MTSTSERSFDLRRVLASVIAVGTATLAALTLASVFLGGVWWGFDAVGSFRFQLALALPLAALVCVLVRRRGVALVAVAVALIAGVGVVEDCARTAPLPTGAVGGVRIASANVLSTNADHASLLAWVRAEEPDVLCVLEVSPAWAQALLDGLPDYPVRALVPRGDDFGIAIFARSTAARRVGWTSSRASRPRWPRASRSAAARSRSSPWRALPRLVLVLALDDLGAGSTPR